MMIQCAVMVSVFLAHAELLAMLTIMKKHVEGTKGYSVLEFMVLIGWDCALTLVRMEQMLMVT